MKKMREEVSGPPEPSAIPGRVGGWRPGTHQEPHTPGMRVRGDRGEPSVCTLVVQAPSWVTAGSRPGHSPLIRIGLVISAEVQVPPACRHLSRSVGLRTQPAASPVA